jgi:hypothetical protein
MKKSIIIFLIVFTFILTGCNPTNKQSPVNSADIINIARYPQPLSFGRHILHSLPSINSKEVFSVDLRSYDLTFMNIKDKVDDLMYASFDSKTIWSKDMPDSFNPQKIMELGKSPGLGIEKLHKTGVTGKGVGIGIIDQALLVEHVEYKDNLKLYEEIHCADNTAQMHGPAVASIAVGKTTGVAPNADLYYIAETHGTYTSNGFEWDFTSIAESIDRILEVNKSLPKNKKIRVISISVGWNKSQKGYNEVTAAVNRAKEQGVFVVSSSLIDTYGYMFSGIGRQPLKNPDDKTSYEPGLFWANLYYESGQKYFTYFGVKEDQVLLVPMDSRTTASPTGYNDYVFYREGGWSWSIPYIAGLYALACQVNPDITPDIFWDKALKTGDTINIDYNGKSYELKKIVNPAKLIEDIRKNK